MQDSGTPDAPRPLVGDIVYAEAILDAARKASADRHRKRAWLPALLRPLGNGFVLLVVGALITDVLVPRYQTRQADRAARRAARQEALGQFLLYSNSRWQEYYLLPPLLTEDLSDAAYRGLLEQLTRIKVARYDAFARLQAAALAFRKHPGTPNQEIEDALADYAVRVNDLSTEIDGWVRNKYCWSHRCRSTPAAPLDPQFNPYDSFEQIKSETVDFHNLDIDLAERLARSIEVDL